MHDTRSDNFNPPGLSSTSVHLVEAETSALPPCRTGLDTGLFKSPMYCRQIIHTRHMQIFPN